MRIKPTIEQIYKYTKQKHNGKCLESDYRSNKAIMLWECSEGHQWKACWHSVGLGSWCPYCARTVKPTIEECNDYVRENYNGKCLDAIYVNAHTKMNWECSEGHQWKTNWNHINSHKTWCAICAGQIKPEIEQLQFFAENKNGKLLSTTYVNRESHLLWECEKGHQWEATWNNVLKGTWCPSCFGNAVTDISECQEFAKNKKGKLLSIKYITAKSKMLWECEKGHQWRTSWDSIRRSSWCPECSRFKTEYKCKELLEQKFQFTFSKTRFTHKNNIYEWDGYNEEYKIAFEYQGYQHYIYPNRWQKTLEIHKTAKQRDLDKVIYARENNIKLLIIPYTEEKNLESYITNLPMN